MGILLDSIVEGSCELVIPALDNDSVDLVITSPPYADQRKGLYKGISEVDYPAWFAGIALLLLPKVKLQGSFLVVIRPHIHDGELSDYVMRTRLAVRSTGWFECEELIWLKPDAPPLGSRVRPRRVWESVLWFGRSRQPFIDLHACGRPSTMIGFEGSTRFGVGGVSPIKDAGGDRRSGVAKVTDVVTATIGSMAKGVAHPAMFPQPLCEQLIKTFSREGDVIFDPFVGSGTVALAAQKLGRGYVGCDISAEFVGIARDRLAEQTDIFGLI